MELIFFDFLLASGSPIELVHDVAGGGGGGSGPKPITPMVVLGIIMAVTYLVIAFEWMHKTVAAMVGAIVAVAAALWFHVFKGGSGGSEYSKAVHDIIGHDIGVIGVIVGTSILVEIASRSGLFHFLAVKIVKRTQGDPMKLLTLMIVATVLFVTFLTIAPGTMIMVSLALVVCKELHLSPKPYIIAIAVTANSGALMTLASGICTLMLGHAGDLPYLHFFRVTSPMALISAWIAWEWIRRFYKKDIVSPDTPEERRAKVASFDEWALVKDVRLFYRSAIILGLTIVGFALSQKLGVGLDYIAFIGATTALLVSGIYPDEAIKKVNWSLVLFFTGLFVIIGSVQETGLLAVLAKNIIAWSGGNETVTLLLLTLFTMPLSGIVDNIPVAATMIPIVREMGVQGVATDPLWWSLILTCNLGGNSTPIGSVSTVIALNALEKEGGVKVGWGEFLRMGGILTLVQGAAIVLYLWAFSTFGLFPSR